MCFGKSPRFPNKGDMENMKMEHLALLIDSTHFAPAFCLKKPFFNILHASSVLVSL